MIELDEAESENEWVRCTCLDRGRIALQQTGQHHCAMILGKLQKAFEDVAAYNGLNSNRPVEILRYLEAVSLDETDAEEVWFEEAKR